MNRLAKLLAGFATGAVLVSAAFADEFALNLPQESDDPIAIPLPDDIVEEPSEVLQVFVGPAEGCCSDRMPVAGRYALEDNKLSFTPAFGFEAGQDYVARVGLAPVEELAAFSIRSEAASDAVSVNKIYPSADVLPENVLRFYIHFSAPMKPGVAFDYIKLRDAFGTVDEAAFMKFKQELWNADRTRLTVLIDPGRIKRDVATNRELGPALVSGNEYTLTVDGNWPSANGQSELAPFSKSFSVSAALRDRPDVGLWKANSPCIGTDEALKLRFDRPFDRHLLEKDIRVTVGNKRVVSGVIDIGEGERSWQFQPNEPWTNEAIEVIASSKLEDIAANNFYDLLDQAQGYGAAAAKSNVLQIQLKSCNSEY